MWLCISSEEAVKSANEKNKPIILINNLVNEECKEISNYNYDSLTDVIKDEEITNKIYNLIHGETKWQIKFCSGLLSVKV